MSARWLLAMCGPAAVCAVPAVCKGRGEVCGQSREGDKPSVTAGLQEVFLTPHHLAIAMEYAAGGDLSEYVQANKLPGVRTHTRSAQLEQQAGLLSHRCGIGWILAGRCATAARQLTAVAQSLIRYADGHPGVGRAVAVPAAAHSRGLLPPPGHRQPRHQGGVQ